jgi:hypothetical protein
MRIKSWLMEAIAGFLLGLVGGIISIRYNLLWLEFACVIIGTFVFGHGLLRGEQTWRTK